MVAVQQAILYTPIIPSPYAYLCYLQGSQRKKNGLTIRGEDAIIAQFCLMSTTSVINRNSATSISYDQGGERGTTKDNLFDGSKFFTILIENDMKPDVNCRLYCSY